MQSTILIIIMVVLLFPLDVYSHHFASTETTLEDESSTSSDVLTGSNYGSSLDANSFICTPTDTDFKSSCPHASNSSFTTNNDKLILTLLLCCLILLFVMAIFITYPLCQCSTFKYKLTARLRLRRPNPQDTNSAIQLSDSVTWTTSPLYSHPQPACV